jgi:competence protein ComGB
MKHIKTNWNRLGKYDAHFLEKLSLLISNGFKMHQALIFLVEQYEVLKKPLKTKVLSAVNEGKSISDILRMLGYRNSIIIQMEFAEIHGEIEKNLIDSSLYIKQKRETLKKLLKAIQYPMILVSIFIIMLIVLNYTVIPQFKTLYSAMGTEVQGVVQVLTIMLEYLPIVVLSVASLGCLFAVIMIIVLRIRDVNRQCAIILRVPFVRFYFINYQTMHFSREFGYFINNGLEVKDIITLFKEQELNMYLKQAAILIEHELMKGRTLTDAVACIPYLDNRICSFISHGEYSSSVGKELLLFSEYTLEKLIMKTENITKRIQPVIFLILGMLIVCLYLVIILPVFQMMSQIN